MVVCAGRNWKEKLEDVRSEMKKKAASVLVVTALDEVACKTITVIVSITGTCMQHVLLEFCVYIRL